MNRIIVLAAVLTVAIPSIAAAQSGQRASGTGTSAKPAAGKIERKTRAGGTSQTNVGAGAGSPSAIDTATGRSSQGAGSASSSMGNAASSK